MRGWVCCFFNLKVNLELFFSFTFTFGLFFCVVIFFPSLVDCCCCCCLNSVFLVHPVPDLLTSQTETGLYLGQQCLTKIWSLTTLH